MPDRSPGKPHSLETAELRRLRKKIDALDRRLVAILNERAELARDAGRAKRAAGYRGIRDVEREREVLLRVTTRMKARSPRRCSLYRQLFAARALEARDRDRADAERTE